MRREKHDKSVTIYTIADEAGVSISTVSLAVNHPERVSTTTRARVFEAAGRLGYRPGGTPSARAKTYHGRIAVIAPFTSYPSYSLRLGGVLAAVCTSGLETLVHDMDSAAAVLDPLLGSLPVRGDIDGVIIMGIPLTEAALERVRRWGPPTVLVDVDAEEVPSVRLDDQLGGELVARHLVERGCRSIAFVHEMQHSDAYVSSGMHRVDGLNAVLAAQGLPPATLIAVADGSVDAGRTAVDRLIELRPDAVFANHDLLAAGILAGMRDRGFRAPNDYLLVGFDDGPLADGLDLTTVRQPFTEFGRHAMRLLRDQIAGKALSSARVILNGELIVRGSTGNAGPRSALAL